MAHAVKQKRNVTIHHAVHGYADGHREIVSTRKLESQDQRTMLVLSDISGSSMRIDEQGYLTGYPLADSGVYALARTWAAPEMPRPGCVWTHTLLIEFSDLAILESPRLLNALFRRPSLGSTADYREPMQLDTPLITSHDDLTNNEIEWCRTVVSGLYSNPRSLVVANRIDCVDIDVATMEIWWQQWPALRRSFRFCTHTTSDRSSAGANFDLQLLGKTELHFRSEFDGAYFVKDEPISPNWVDLSIQDLKFHQRSSLRGFLNRVGSDAVQGREAFAPLCELYQLIFQNYVDATDIKKIFDVRKTLFKRSSKSLNLIISSKLISSLDSASESHIEYLVSNLNTLNSEALQTYGAKLGEVAWSMSPTLFTNLLRAKQPTGFSPYVYWENLGTEEVLRNLNNDPRLAADFAEARPEVMSLAAFWTRRLLDEAAAKSLLNTVNNLEFLVFKAIVDAERTDLLDCLIYRFSALTVLRLLSQMEWLWSHSHAWEWIGPCTRNVDNVAEFLVTESDIPVGFLIAIAYATRPDDVPNSFGEDPWLVAIGRAKGSGMMEDGWAYLLGFIFCRAIGGVSKNPEGLLIFSFDDLHRLTADRKLPEKIWRLVEPKLPYTFFWANWDKCVRLRTVVVNSFVENKLSPAEFIQITKDDELFEQLMALATVMWNGREFVTAVRHELEDTGNYSRLKRIKRLTL